MSYQFKVQVLLPYSKAKRRWARFDVISECFFFFFQCSPPTIYLLFWISELCVKAKGFSVTFNVSKFPSVTQNETVATFSEMSCTSGSYQLWLNRFVGGGRSEIGL